MRCAVFAAVFAFLGFCGLSAGQPKSTAKGTPKKIALLVGVQNYKSAELTPLSGCVNDVLDLEQALTTKFGFVQSGIKKLLNEQATHASIVRAFQGHLIAQATKDTAVLFYFSGHGSQMRDHQASEDKKHKKLEGDESDRWDETLCPYDTRTANVFDISDDDVAGLLAVLAKKTANVTVIFDSCHSGSITRGIAVARTVPRDDRPPPNRPPYAISTKSLRNLRSGSAASPVVISASLAHQLSFEMDQAGVRRGLFTYNFVQQLRLSDADTTWRDIIERTKASVQREIGNQEPNGEGRIDVVPFGSKESLRQPYFLLRQNPGALSVEGGLVHGLTVGSTFNVYPPETKTFSGSGIGRVRLTSVETLKTSAEPVGERREFPDLSRAVEFEHSFGTTPFRVCFRGNDEQFKRDCVALLAQVPGVGQTEVPEASSLLINADSERVRLTDPSGTLELTVFPKSEFDAGAFIAAVRRWAFWTAAARTTNPVHAFKGSFKVRRPESTRGAKGWFAAEQSFKDGETIEIFVRNSSTAPMFFTVLNFSSDGTIAKVYPPGAPEQIAPNSDWSRPSIVSAGPGKKVTREILKLVVSRNPIDFSPILTKKDEERAPDELMRVVAPVGATRADEWATAEQIFDVISSAE